MYYNFVIVSHLDRFGAVLKKLADLANSDVSSANEDASKKRGHTK